MGDTNNPLTEETEKSPQIQESVTNALRSVKPSANIAIASATSLPSEEELKKIHETAASEENLANGSGPKDDSTENIKTDGPEKPEGPIAKDVPETPTPSEEKLPRPQEDPPAPTSLDKKPKAGSAATGLNQNDRLLRNQSDIFSLKEQTSVSSSIFSINGSPSRKVSRKREPIPFGGLPSEQPSDKESTDRLRDRGSYNDMKRPTSSLRNPLTGTGLSSNDEYRFKSSKRKDGNPLLGLGYDPEVVPSGHRIPPGGYSHKLW